MTASRRSRFHFGAVYLTSLGVWLTGTAWLVFHYFVRHESQFGLSPHPLERWWLAAHGAFAFASLWLMGFLWAVHIVNWWQAHRHRKTGGLLFGTFAILAVSGYLLYYVGDEGWRAAISPLHWAVGLALPLALLGHWVIRRR